MSDIRAAWYPGATLLAERSIDRVSVPTFAMAAVIAMIDQRLSDGAGTS